VWDFRARRPEEARIFDRAMASGTEHFAEAVIAAYDFSRFQDIVDIGGGDGMFLAKILASQPRSRGTLFDQPNVVDRGAALLRSHGLGDRSQAVGGSFFVNVPNGGDAYLLKWILHDWQDTAATDILRCCRRVMKPSSRLLVVEHVIGAPNVSPSGKFMDLTMMVVTGGRERTCDEFAALFAEAGFRLLSIIPTATELSILEGAPEMARRSIA
jgi:hypothetical protein